MNFFATKTNESLKLFPKFKVEYKIEAAHLWIAPQGVRLTLILPFQDMCCGYSK